MQLKSNVLQRSWISAAAVSLPEEEVVVMWQGMNGWVSKNTISIMERFCSQSRHFFSTYTLILSFKSYTSALNYHIVFWSYIWYGAAPFRIGSSDIRLIFQTCVFRVARITLRLDLTDRQTGGGQPEEPLSSDPSWRWILFCTLQRAFGMLIIIHSKSKYWPFWHRSLINNI